MDPGSLTLLAILAGTLALCVQLFWQTTHCPCRSVGKAGAEQRATRREQERSQERSEDEDLDW